MLDIGLIWQLTIKTINDVKVVGNEKLTLEMYIMQLVHLQKIEDKKILGDSAQSESQDLKNNLIGKKIKDEDLDSDLSNQVKNQLKNTDQVKTNPKENLSPEASINEININNFRDLIDLANKEKEVELKFDLERNVKLVSFTKGKIDISFNENLNKNFIKNLTEKLLFWTGKRWIISLSKNTEAKSIYEKNSEQKLSKLMEFKNSDLAKQIEEAFPDADLIDIKEDKDE
jgi:DNA polymerase-3 subunit gamma/tau